MLSWKVSGKVPVLVQHRIAESIKSLESDFATAGFRTQRLLQPVRQLAGFPQIHSPGQEGMWVSLAFRTRLSRWKNEKP